MKILVKRHNRSEVELRLSYPIDIPRRRQIKLDLYLFLPFQVKPGQNSDRFQPSVRRYNFYKSLAVGWDELFDSSNKSSPLSTIPAYLGNDDVSDKKIIFELKTLIVILHRLVNLVHQQHWPDARQFEGFILTKVKLLQQAENFLLENSQLCLQRRPEAVYQHFAIAAEDLSYLTLRFLLKSLRILSKRHYVSNEITSEIAQEQQKLQNHGFSTLSADEEANESYLFRLHELKKWRLSALYLTTTATSRIKLLQEILLVGATGIAMAIYLSIAFWRHTQSPWSGGWLLILWLGYILRDRVKEWMGKVLYRSVKPIIGNLHHIIIDPLTGKRYGKIREYVHQPKADDLHEEIRQLRQLYQPPASLQMTNEIIFNYHEVIEFNNRKFLRLHRRLNTAGQILRLNLTDCLHHLDCENKTLLHFANQQLKKLTISRCYHFNLLLRVADRHGATLIERYRLIVRNYQIEKIQLVK